MSTTPEQMPVEAHHNCVESMKQYGRKKEAMVAPQSVFGNLSSGMNLLWKPYLRNTNLSNVRYGVFSYRLLHCHHKHLQVCLVDSLSSSAIA
jgi:hypothetical protein